jgi:hypothetical protein
MGFIPRTDIRNVQARAAWTPRPRWPGVRQLTIGGSVSHFENHAGRTESRNQGLDFTLMKHDSSRLRVGLDREYDSRQRSLCRLQRGLGDRCPRRSVGLAPAPE